MPGKKGKKGKKSGGGKKKSAKGGKGAGAGGGPTVIDGIATQDMTPQQLEEAVVRMREEMDREREERNYFQVTLTPHHPSKPP